MQAYLVEGGGALVQGCQVHHTARRKVHASVSANCFLPPAVCGVSPCHRFELAQTLGLMPPFLTDDIIILGCLGCDSPSALSRQFSKMRLPTICKLNLCLTTAPSPDLTQCPASPGAQTYRAPKVCEHSPNDKPKRRSTGDIGITALGTIHQQIYQSCQPQNFLHAS